MPVPAPISVLISVPVTSVAKVGVPPPEKIPGSAKLVLLLKVAQSVDVKYPSVLVFAFVILNDPVEVTEPDKGAVVVTEVTVPVLAVKPEGFVLL